MTRKFLFFTKEGVFGLMLLASATSVFSAVGELTPLPNHNILRLAPIPDSLNPEVPATAGQFGSASFSVGGRESTATGGWTLLASFGRPFNANAPDFLFGDIITPPVVDVDGVLLADLGVDPLDYWLPRPLSPGEEVKVYDSTSDASSNIVPLDADASIRFYYSPHAKVVYASDEGRIAITWRTRLPVDDATNGFGILAQQFNVSSSSRLTVRRLFWTEGKYSGPNVSVSSNVVPELKVIFNSAMPEAVATEEAVLPPALEGAPIEKRTVWLDETTSVGSLRAINREGRLMIEYLGPTTGEKDGALALREPVGLEVVDVIRETRPVEVTTYIGEQLLPSPNGVLIDPDSGDLESVNPDLINIAGAGSFVKDEFVEGATLRYAVGENNEPLRVQYYWMERGQSDIRWPRYLNGYRLLWPEGLQDYPGKFLRPSDSALSDSSFVALPRKNTPELIYHDGETEGEATIDFQGKFFVDFSNAPDAVNRSLLRFSSGNRFWYVRVHSEKEEQLGTQDGDSEIDLQLTGLVGSRLASPVTNGSVAGYIDTSYGTAYNAGAYIDPFDEGGVAAAEQGSIIPVNALPDNNKLRVWWFETVPPPPGLEDFFEPLFFPSTVAEYALEYPSNAQQIVLASNLGSGELGGAQANGAIYVQNDPSQHGYNPNEEHSLMLGGRAYALRDDLNAAGVSSEPFTLVDYIDTDGRPSMAIYEVLRENDVYAFDYEATAGTILQAPMPLAVMPLPLVDKDGVWVSKNTEVDLDEAGEVEDDSDAGTELESVPDLAVNDASAERFPHYNAFTYEDRKGQKWVYRGPHETGVLAEGTAARFKMQFYYKTQEGFAFPDAQTGFDVPPEVGTVVPYLRERGAGDVFEGNAITGESLDISFSPRWPELVPELRIGETLTLPKFGLPQVRGQRSLQLLYQGSHTGHVDGDDVAPDTEIGPPSVVLHDPTRQKVYLLSESGLDKIPPSIATTQSRGKTYFQNLPTHLQTRLFLDPNLGKRGGLVFQGEFVDEIVGEDYLLLNVLSGPDLESAKGLVAAGGDLEAQWHTAIDELSTTLEQFIEDPDVRGTYIVNPEEGVNTVFEAAQSVELESPPEPSQGSDPDAPVFFDEAVDSYALTATGGGEGYVVMMAGNGQAFTPEGEPVAVHIIRVGGGLYRGELKPLVAGNPLSENVTVQHTGDFAGDASAYEFEWRKAPPVDGLSPSVYEFSHIGVPADAGLWSVSGNLLDAGDAGNQPNPVELTLANAADPRFTTFTGEFPLNSLIPNGSELSTVYFKLVKKATDEIRVFVNGVVALDTREDLPLSSPPSEVLSYFADSSSIYAVEKRYFEGAAVEEEIVLEYESSADPGAKTTFGLSVAATLQVDQSTQNYLALAQEEGKNRHLVSGAGIDTLSDNWFIMRYRPAEGNSLYPEGGYTVDEPGWSDWTRPALVEGWIKRVLAGINPFNQRVSDFFDNAVDTDVSLITQAGTRWEGDIALNLEAVQDAGLIEIYETVLNRGISLSIGGTPKIDYGPANDALLLAAGYLSDLYMILGNEAYADASNPTILFDSQAIGTIADDSVALDFESVFRNTATARFAFQGQVSSLLEEELHLLRGRDDFLAPGIEIAPIYNRLFWNYTRGIDAGEVIYALNYNITEKDEDGADGKIDAADASRMFPQGHGDAYGHYLTALTGYYRLLTDDFFTWGTRSEAVNILGQPVSVDYLDERKFARAAVAVAGTSEQIQSLEHRKALLDVPESGWSHYDGTRENARTGRTRPWSFDDWSSRGGQGAYYNWITANALLPEEDAIHEGIQKIDRTTVLELDELALSAAAIQQRMDSANAGLNPLGLTDDSLVFDISPQEQADGATHFEQIYERATRSLQNAFEVFDRATESSRLLRSMENQNQNLNAAVVDQERAFNLELLDIYGAAYPGDIGPGKTYPQGYEGPDLFRSFYIDRPYEVFSKEQLFEYKNHHDEVSTFRLQIPNAKFQALIGDPINFTTFADEAETLKTTLTYRYVETDGPYQFSESDSGKRKSVGSIQSALAEVRLAEEKFYASLAGMDRAHDIFFAYLQDYQKDQVARIATITTDTALDTAKTIHREIVENVKLVRSANKIISEGEDEFKKSAIDLIPKVAGVSNDISPPAKAPIYATSLITRAAAQAADLVSAKSENIANAVYASVELATKYAKRGFEDEVHYRAQGTALLAEYRKAFAKRREVDAAYVAYTRALERYRNEMARGDRILAKREIFRKRAAAIVQGYRTRDVAFRAFRTEALEQYQTLFDWAAKYAYLAAQAYDYETGLLGSDAGRNFLGGVTASRALGLLDDEGQPMFAASELGDPGLSGFLAKLKTDWDVVEGRLGFNNPDVYGTTFSLRKEYFRIPETADGDRQWKELLARLVTPNLLAHADVAAHALQIDTAGGVPLPGIVIEFPTEIAAGLNFFGQPLASNDHRFTESNFATKIHSSGVVFEGYEGMDPCYLCLGGSTEHIHDNTHAHEDALSATPHVYLIPAGEDRMRTPPIGDGLNERSWQVLDHALPLPFDIGQIGSNTDDSLYSSGSQTVGDDFMAARKHQAFRAVNTEAFFYANRSDEYTNSRLIGRSVENSRWLLVIPGLELLNDPDEGIQRFINSVSDIKLHLYTYSHAGN